MCTLCRDRLTQSPTNRKQCFLDQAAYGIQNLYLEIKLTFRFLNYKQERNTVCLWRFNVHYIASVNISELWSCSSPKWSNCLCPGYLPLSTPPPLLRDPGRFLIDCQELRMPRIQGSSRWSNTTSTKLGAKYISDFTINAQLTKYECNLPLFLVFWLKTG